MSESSKIPLNMMLCSYNPAPTLAVTLWKSCLVSPQLPSLQSEGRAVVRFPYIIAFQVPYSISEHHKDLINAIIYILPKNHCSNNPHIPKSLKSRMKTMYFKSSVWHWCYGIWHNYCYVNRIAGVKGIVLGEPSFIFTASQLSLLLKEG